MGPNSKVYLGSAELAALCALLGRLPSVEEYMSLVPRKLEGKTDKVYTYLNFNRIKDYHLDN
jgi:aconitate hydratase 2/2-methylisocitrate dehydratase